MIESDTIDDVYGYGVDLGSVVGSLHRRPRCSTDAIFKKSLSVSAPL
jgi:hypothetical protein